MVYKYKYLDYKKNWYNENKERLRPINAKQARERRNATSESRIKALITNAKVRAKQKEIPFDLKYEDLELPIICPILNLKIDYDPSNKNGNDRPTLDRVIPERGYTKENTKIISWLANSLKRNGTKELFERIIQYIDNNS